jgi:D-alanyl-D-alanine-carboxypeptidase/D-alanyl-D-alanine-endopeptidase
MAPARCGAKMVWLLLIALIMQVHSSRSLGVALVVLLSGACSASTSSTPDLSTIVDAGDGMVSDGSNDSSSDVRGEDIDDVYKRIVSDVVAPLVDPKAALHDFDKTAGLMVVVVSEAHSAVYGFGSAFSDRVEPPDGDTIFQIGSVSKVFTGLLLAREVASKKLALADAADAHLPEQLRGHRGTRDVTLGMLVSHYSGHKNRPENQTDRDWDGQTDASSDRLSPAQGYSAADLAACLQRCTKGRPATKYLYSNVGIGLLGLALEHHVGANGYHDLLRRTLLADFALGDVWGKVDEIPQAVRKRRTASYSTTPNGRVVGRFSQMGVMAGAGEISMTGHAMRSFLQVLTGMRGVFPMVDEAIRPLETANKGEHIGYALDILSSSDGPVYAKAGSTVGGFSTYIAFRRNPKVGVALMANVDKFKPKPPTLAILDALTQRARR